MMEGVFWKGNSLYDLYKVAYTPGMHKPIIDRANALGMI